MIVQYGSSVYIQYFAVGVYSYAKIIWWKRGEGVRKVGFKVKNRYNVVSPITRKLYAEIQYFFEKEFVNRLL